MFIENLIAAILGLCLHFAMKWAEARQSDSVGFIDYVKAVPARTAVAVFGAASVFWVAHTMEWLNPGMGMACGYMGHSIADNLAKRFSKIPQG